MSTTCHVRALSPCGVHDTICPAFVGTHSTSLSAKSLIDLLAIYELDPYTEAVLFTFRNLTDKAEAVMAHVAERFQEEPRT